MRIATAVAIRSLFFNNVVSSRSLLCCDWQQEESTRDQLSKMRLSTVRINERFGTAIAIRVFSIGSYSSTTGFIVICHS